MAYEGNREKVLKIIENSIIPYIRKNHDVDYYKLINDLSTHVGCSVKVVERIVDEKIRSGELTESRVLTIKSEEVPNFITDLVNSEKEENEEIEEVFRV